MHEIFVTLGLKILRPLRLKVFLKQTTFKVDASYCKNDELPVFYVYIVNGSKIHPKVKKILQIFLKNFCESHP